MELSCSNYFLFDVTQKSEISVLPQLQLQIETKTKFGKLWLIKAFCVADIIYAEPEASR